MCENVQLLFAVFRIGIYSFFRRLCGMGPPPVRPNFTVLCLGLTNSGKSTLLAVLSGESADAIRPTIGFSIKALMFDECFVDVKELGGGDTVRPYWDKYYLGAQGVIFVVDSSADEENYKIASTELHNALADPELDRLPLLVLCNCQDKPGARNQDEITKLLGLEHETGRRKWTIQCCNKSDRDSIKAGFDRLNKYLIEDSNSAKKSDESEDDFNKI